MKVVTYLFLNSCAALFAEMIVVGERAGLSHEIMKRCRSKGSCRVPCFPRRPRGCSREISRGAVEIFVKDMGLSIEFAKEFDIVLAVVPAARKMFQRAEAAGWGKDDASRVLEVYEGKRARTSSKPRSARWAVRPGSVSSKNPPIPGRIFRRPASAPARFQPGPLFSVSEALFNQSITRRIQCCFWFRGLPRAGNATCNSSSRTQPGSTRLWVQPGLANPAVLNQERPESRPVFQRRSIMEQFWGVAITAVLLILPIRAAIESYREKVKRKREILS